MKIPYAELVFLRKGKPREIRVPFVRRDGGSLKRSPCTAGRAYVVTSTEIVDDEPVKHRATATCLQVLKGEQDWFITLKLGDNLDKPRLLKASPSAAGVIRKKPKDITPEDEHDDYTDRIGLALRDEPEAIDETTQNRYASENYKNGHVAAQHQLDYETRRQRDILRTTVAELQARKDLGEAAAKRLTRVQRELARFERELVARPTMR